MITIIDFHSICMYFSILTYSTNWASIVLLWARVREVLLYVLIAFIGQTSVPAIQRYSPLANNHTEITNLRKMMLYNNIRRSATTLLAISTRRNFILSTSTFASLVIVASPFSTFAATPLTTKRYKTSCTDSKLMMADVTGYLNAQESPRLYCFIVWIRVFSIKSRRFGYFIWP